MKHLYLLLFSVLVIVAGCQTPQKLLKNGHYEAAVVKAAIKLTKKQKDKHVLALEKAFRIVQEKDLTRIERLKLEGDPNCWEEIYGLYTNIRNRQDLIKPLLPLSIKSEFRDADIKLIDVDEQLVEAKQKAANYLYAHALSLLGQYDRLKARDAYYELKKVQEFYPDFKDVDAQLKKAHEMGINSVLIQVKEKENMRLPTGWEQEVINFNPASLDNTWLRYYNEPQEDINFDYTISINFEEIYPGADRVSEREFMEEKEVQDGWQYVLDDNGNVVKDSLENDVKTPKYKIISCRILEVHQQKVAVAVGTADFMDNRNKRPVFSVPFNETVIFENHASRAEGNIHALKEATKARLGGQPLPFPADEAMLMNMARKMRASISRIITENYALVLN